MENVSFKLPQLDGCCIFKSRNEYISIRSGFDPHPLCCWLPSPIHTRQPANTLITTSQKKMPVVAGETGPMLQHTHTHTQHNQSAVAPSHYSGVCRGLSSAQLLMQYSDVGFTGRVGRRCSEVTEQSLEGVCALMCVCASVRACQFECGCVCFGREAQDTLSLKIDWIQPVKRGQL